MQPLSAHPIPHHHHHTHSLEVTDKDFPADTVLENGKIKKIKALGLFLLLKFPRCGENQSKQMADGITG